MKNPAKYVGEICGYLLALPLGLVSLLWLLGCCFLLGVAVTAFAAGVILAVPGVLTLFIAGCLAAPNKMVESVRKNLGREKPPTSREN